MSHLMKGFNHGYPAFLEAAGFLIPLIIFTAVIILIGHLFFIVWLKFDNWVNKNDH